MRGPRVVNLAIDELFLGCFCWVKKEEEGGYQRKLYERAPLYSEGGGEMCWLVGWRERLPANFGVNWSV